MNKEILDMLFDLKDLGYKKFHCRLMPTVERDRVIGVRIPELKKLAKSLYGTVKAQAFLKTLPHYYYEENNLHAFLIAQIKDFDECIKAVDEFLPFIDNWATCDSLRPKIFAKNKEILLKKIKIWIKSDKTYTARFGIEMLMVHFLDDSFNPQFAEWVISADSEEYYVMMMKAWYFATSLVNHFEEIIPIFEQKRLDKTTHNKAISKSIESYRISAEQKKYLRTLKID